MLVRELLFELGFDSVAAEKHAGRMDKLVVGLRRNLLRMGAAAGAATIALGAAAVGAGNEYQEMGNKLKLVTDSAEQLDHVQKELFKTSMNSRTSLSATTDLYFGLAKASQQYGFSTEQVITATEQLGKLGAMSGNDPASVAAAMFQFRQGIMSGQLRGQELNSVLEQATPIAEAIALGMGKQLKNIRKMAEAGQLDGKTVMEAILKMQSNTDSEFAKTQRTAKQARQAMRDTFTFAAGRLANDGDLVAAQVDFWDAIRDIIGDDSFKSSLKFAIDAMAAIIRGITWLITKIGDLISAWGGLDNILRDVTAALLAIATLMIAKNIPYMIFLIKYLWFSVTAAMAAAGGFWALAASVLAASLPILAIIALLGLVFLVIQDLMHENSLLGRAFDKIWEKIAGWIVSARDAVVEFGQALSNLPDKLGDFLMNVTSGETALDRMQAEQARKQRLATANQNLINNTNVNVTVPPGSSKEQAEYTANVVRKAVKEERTKEYRQARANFVETE